METMSKLAELTSSRLHEDGESDDERPALREREIPTPFLECERPDSQASMGIPTEKVGLCTLALLSLSLSVSLSLLSLSSLSAVGGGH